MKSSLARVILALLGGYIFITFFLIALDWYRERYPSHPGYHQDTEQIRYPELHHIAIEALDKYTRLEQDEQESITGNLDAQLIPVDQGLALLHKSEVKIVCIGEHQEESTRRFLAEKILTEISIDRLVLETTEKELEHLLQLLKDGKPYFPMLGADIMTVLRTVRSENPETRIFAIEETALQQKRP